MFEHWLFNLLDLHWSFLKITSWAAWRSVKIGSVFFTPYPQPQSLGSKVIQYREKRINHVLFDSIFIVSYLKLNPFLNHCPFHSYINRQETLCLIKTKDVRKIEWKILPLRRFISVVISDKTSLSRVYMIGCTRIENKD